MTDNIINKTPIDMVMLSIPWWDMYIIPCAPPVLKGIAESYGYNVKILDCNDILKHQFCNNDKTKYFELESYFCHVNSLPSLTVVDDFYKSVVDTVVDIVNKNNVRYIALSVFSVFTQRAALELTQQLRTKISVPIIVGGRGLTTKPNVSIIQQLTASEKMISFADILRKRKLVDYAIEGDGEDAIVDLLNGTIDLLVPKQFTALSKSLEYPFSNFDDFQFENYKLYDKIQLPVISSKGCVRSCDFCDVAAHMSKFQSKDGNRLAEEMIYLSNKHKINEFALTDSIANGNLKELKNTVSFLGNYNNSVSDDDKIFWSGNWICRPRNSIKPEFFDLLKQSGCKHVTIGAEHGSDRVLSAMNKKTNVDGLFYEVEQMHQVGIQCIYNNIVGHWSEFFEDFEKLIEMWMWSGPYIANRTVSGISLTMFAALDNTPATNHTDLNQLVRSDDNFTLLTYSKLNPTLTLKTKIMRYVILLKIAIKFNLPVTSISALRTVDAYLSDDAQLEKYNNFIKNNINLTDNIECKKTIDFYNNTQISTDALVEKKCPTVDISLAFTASAVNGNPRLQITHNQLIVYDQEMVEGPNEIKLQLPNDFKNTNFLKLSLTNKGQVDTVVDEAGNIVKDKCIKFSSIVIDKIDLLKTNIDFYYKQNSAPGLYRSGEDIVFEYQAPFWRHFVQNTPNNTEWKSDTDLTQANELTNSIKKKLNQLKC